MAKGDLIYVNRNHEYLPIQFKHYGIDCGDGTVIHYAEINNNKYRYHEIIQESLYSFASINDVFIFIAIYDDNDGFCYSPEAVVERAESRLGEREYDLWKNNCEHFARWCKTGKSISYQTGSLDQIEEKENSKKGVTNVLETDLGVAFGASVAGSVATTTTSIPIVTSLTGIAIVTAAPISLVAGAVLGAAIFFGISQIFPRGNGENSDRTQLYIYLENLIKINNISKEIIQWLVYGVESGQLSVYKAYFLADNLANN